jgi:hypothetical protein
VPNKNLSRDLKAASQSQSTENGLNVMFYSSLADAKPAPDLAVRDLGRKKQCNFALSRSEDLTLEVSFT